MPPRTNRTTRKALLVPKCVSAKDAFDATSAIVGHTSFVPGRRLPPLQYTDWRMVFMASSALCNDFTQHVCDAHSQDECARFQRDLQLLQTTVVQLERWRKDSCLPPLGEIYAVGEPQVKLTP